MRLLLLALFATSSYAAPLFLQKTVHRYDGPSEWVNHNTSRDTSAMTEIRAINDVGCAMDLGTVSSTYSADRSIKPNEAFLVSESSCSGMTIKANGVKSYIRFAIETTELARLRADGSLTISPSETCPFDTPPSSAGLLCVSEDGSLWYQGPNGRNTRLALP